MSSTLLKHNEDDLRLLMNELAEVKEVLRDCSRQLLRIERRVSAALPRTAGASRVTASGSRSRLDEPAAQQLIDQLRLRASKGEQIEGSLRGFSVKPELLTVAKILGMTNTKLPPKDELVRRISTRIRQSAAVTTG